MSKTKVRVIIDGLEFNIVGEEDKVYIERLAKDVDRLIQQQYRKNPNLSKLEAALLVAINLRDDFEKSSDKVKELQKQVNPDEYKELMTKEEALERILHLEDRLKLQEDKLEKYKKSEAMSSEQLRKESARYKESYSKTRQLENTLKSKNDLINNLNQRLANQEKENRDNEAELKELRRELQNLSKNK